MATISRKYLSIRYSLLPYYYTLFFKAHHDPTDIEVLLPSAVVLKPLFYDFYKDPNSLSIDRQFLVGSALLISPQLQLGMIFIIKRARSASVHTNHDKRVSMARPRVRTYVWYVWAGHDGEEFRAHFFNAVAFLLVTYYP